LYFLDRFDVLMSKMIFKKWKNIIGMYFGTKSYLKSNHYHTAKHLNRSKTRVFGIEFQPIFLLKLKKKFKLILLVFLDRFVVLVSKINF
jgi:hypothetical protein